MSPTRDSPTQSHICSHCKCQLKAVAVSCVKYPQPHRKSIHLHYGWKHTSIPLSSYPAHAQELFGYQSPITSANLQLPFSAWMSCDVKFCMVEATCPSLHWNVRYPDLWLEHLTISKSSSSECWPCPHCNSVYHFPDRCPVHASRPQFLQPLISNQLI